MTAKFHLSPPPFRWVLFIIAYLYVIITVLLSGCSPVQQFPTTVEPDTSRHSVRIEYRDRWLRDSIYIHDSITVYTQGDTVFVIERRDRSRNRDLHDTVYVNIHDTVFVPKYVPKFLEIPRELTREEQTKITIGEWTINIAVALAVALLVFLTIKILKR